MNRRSFLKKALGGFLTTIGLSGGTYYYAREVEPALLQITNESILSPKIPKAFNKFKIIQFSDTHLGFHYTFEQLSKLVKKINQLKPDLIVFTGDLIDDPNIFHQTDEIAKILSDLSAPFGKLWIYGNHDHGGYGTNILKTIMNTAGFTLLQNENVQIVKDHEQITIAGIDDLMLGKPDLYKTLRNTNPDLFTILLAHEPDYADHARKFPIDVQLSGHSHGGQVRLPFIGHLYTPAYATKYIQGKYIFEGEAFVLYVNQGIGTTRLPYRFLCTPELHCYTLQNK